MGKVHSKLIIGRVRMLLRRNCDIIVDESEIDTNITISENYYILKDKYTCNMNIIDIIDEI